MGASLVYLDRPVTKKETKSGNLPASQTQVGYKYAASGMQGWRLNMVSVLFLISALQTDLAIQIDSFRLSSHLEYRLNAGSVIKKIHNQNVFLCDLIFGYCYIKYVPGWRTHFSNRVHFPTGLDTFGKVGAYICCHFKLAGVD